MPQGDKSAYTDKQKRQAEHIKQSYIKSGLSEDEAEERAWATINKQDGGGKKSGAGRANAKTKAPTKRGGGESVSSGKTQRKQKSASASAA